MLGPVQALALRLLEPVLGLELASVRALQALAQVLELGRAQAAEAEVRLAPVRQQQVLARAQARQGPVSEPASPTLLPSLAHQPWFGS